MGPQREGGRRQSRPALVQQVGELTNTLAEADPGDRAEVYQQRLLENREATGKIVLKPWSR
jgi:hypothetical protein